MLGGIRRRDADRALVPESALKRAEAAYGAVLRPDLAKARIAFLASPEHQERCVHGLGIEDPAGAIEAVKRLVVR